MPKDMDWAVASDLIDDFDFTIESAKFQYDSQDAETVVLVLEGKTSDEDTPVLSEEQENALRVKVGKKWIITGDQTSIEHESGKPKPLNPNSHYGMWVAACIDDLGIVDTLRSRGTLRDAKVWEGLVLHIERKEFSGKIEGEDRKWSKALPSKFIGEAGKANVSAESAAPAATEAPAAASNGIPNMKAALKAKLTKAAKDSADYSAFVDAAFEVPGVSDDTDLQAWLMSEESFNTLKG